MSETTAGPGWFPDPGDPQLLRYWDGSTWTEHTSPMPAAATPLAPTARPTGTDGLAIASLVLGILWLWWIGSILAVVFGHISLNRIKASGDSIPGRGLAIAGLVLGYVGLGFLALLVLIGLIGAASSS